LKAERKSKQLRVKSEWFKVESLKWERRGNGQRPVPIVFKKGNVKRKNGLIRPSVP